MSELYTVASYYEGSSYSLTIRCLKRNSHFKRDEGNPKCIYDSTQGPDAKRFAIMFEGTQTEAKEFYMMVRAAYALRNVTKGLVKNEE